MRLAPSLHSRAMIQRVLVALALASGVIACVDKTTSLGGPEGNQASASSLLDAAPSAAPDAAEADVRAPAADAADAADAARQCVWFRWMPQASAAACTYLMPPSYTPGHGSPYFDPHSPSWNPANVYATTWVMYLPSSTREELVKGQHVPDLASCTADGGWYYDETSVDAEGFHTRYVLCPSTCARTSLPTARFELWATYCKESR